MVTFASDLVYSAAPGFSVLFRSCIMLYVFIINSQKLISSNRFIDTFLKSVIRIIVPNILISDFKKMFDKWRHVRWVSTTLTFICGKQSLNIDQRVSLK